MCKSCDDINAATVALAHWFNSQEINPSTAIKVMVNLEAALVAEVSKRNANPDEHAMKVIDHINACIVHNVGMIFSGKTKAYRI